MTNQEYERQGGFSDELRLVRQIGQTITTLEADIQARLYRRPEIITTRNEAIL